MLRRWIVAVVVLSLAPVAMSLSSTAGSSILPGRYIVVLKDSADTGSSTRRWMARRSGRAPSEGS